MVDETVEDGQRNQQNRVLDVLRLRESAGIGNMEDASENGKFLNIYRLNGV